MIEWAWREWDKCKSWQPSVFGFALAWWLLLAPSAMRALWPLLTRTSLPGVLDRLLPLSYAALAVGSLVALNDLNDFDSKKTPRARLVATWFVLGLLSMILTGALGLMPTETF